MEKMTPSFQRNLGWIFAQRILLVATGFLYAIWVPRALGPEVFGQFTLVYSMILWGMVLAEAGAQSTFSRCFPRMKAGNSSGAASLFRGYRILQMALSAAVALAVGLYAGALAPVDARSRLLLAGAAFFSGAGQVYYAWQLAAGLGARWGLGFVLRRLLGLLAVLYGFRVAGWRGIATGLFLVEAFLFMLGHAWSGRNRRAPFRLPSRARFLCFVGFGMRFHLGGVLLLSWRYLGEWRVRSLNSDPEPLAYYALAMGIYFAVESAVQQVGVLAGPYLSAAGTRAERTARLEGWMTALLLPTLAGCVISPRLAKPLLGLLAGGRYLDAAFLLPWMALALLVYLPVPLYQARMLAEGRHRLNLQSVALRLGSFAVAAGIAGHFLGWRGIVYAMLLSNLLQTLALFLGFRDTRRRLFNAWLLAVVLGLVAVGWG